MSPSRDSSYVTKQRRDAWAMVASSRRRPIQTLPASSAHRAWNSATSGWIAGTIRIGSPSFSGFCMTRQSFLSFRRSEPRTPLKGMKGTPFSAACSALWTAGQVASVMQTSPRSIASVKRGARPASPSDTALDSTSATQPAPISRSADMPSTGTPSSRRLRARRRISACTTAIAGVELSGGRPSSAPSGISTASASASARKAVLFDGRPLKRCPPPSGRRS